MEIGCDFYWIKYMWVQSNTYINKYNNCNRDDELICLLDLCNAEKGKKAHENIYIQRKEKKAEIVESKPPIPVQGL